MNSAKLFNWLLQALAVLLVAVSAATFGKVSWNASKVLMGLSLLVAFSAFFHALFHYLKERNRMKR